jgi:hypothetical protein
MNFTKKSRLEEDVACYQLATIIKLLLAVDLIQLAVIVFLLW